MALNSEYFPKIYDGMLKHNSQVDDKIDKIKNKLDDLIDKENRKYIVNHDPQIELPFEEKYAYIRDKVDKIRCGESLDKNRRLELFTHIFISGYLPNGATIHFDNSDTPGYSELYINGVPYTSDYTCRTTEDGAREKINILAVQTEADPLNGVNGVLRVHYKDMPLKFFKVVLYDDVATQIFPDIDDFLAQEIDTLICYGDYRWTYPSPSTLRVWKGNKGMIQRGQRQLPNLQEFIFPNISFMPNLNYLSNDKSNLRKIDISNCRGVVNYLQSAQLSVDLILQCSSIRDNAFYRADIKNVDVGAYCTSIDRWVFGESKIQSVIIGASMLSIGDNAFRACKFLERVTFKNANPINIGIGDGLAFFDCTSLQDINFSYLQKISKNNVFQGCTALANLTFIDKSISVDLYFGDAPVITEQSCLNIINAIADNAKIKVQLHSTVKTQMTNTWYCKLSDGKYVSCTAEDEGAVTQAAAILARGGTLT